MGEVLRAFSSFFIVRWATLVLIRILWVFSRLFSHLKFKALVRNSGKSVCHHSVEVKYGHNIIIGDYCAIGREGSIGAKSPITIGNNVTISRGVIIETAGLDILKNSGSRHISKPILIEDNVWIGANSIILGGVTIQKDAVIGAGVVVSKDVAAGSIIVGSRNRDINSKN